MGTIDEILISRKALESLVDTPSDIPDQAPVHIKNLDNIKMTLNVLLDGIFVYHFIAILTFFSFCFPYVMVSFVCF